MNRERRIMSLLKDKLPQMFLLGNHQTVLKENNSSIIYREAFSFSYLHILFDPRNPGIMFLGFNDLIPKVRLRHQAGKESLRKNVKIQLPKFLMEKWFTLL